MSKRLHEVAKELGLEMKVLVQKASGLGLSFDVPNNAFKTLTDGEVEELTSAVKRSGGSSERPPESVKTGVVRRRKKEDEAVVAAPVLPPPPATSSATPPPGVKINRPSRPAAPVEAAPAPLPVLSVPAPQPVVAEPAAPAVAAPAPQPAPVPVAPAAGGPVLRKRSFATVVTRPAEELERKPAPAPVPPPAPVVTTPAVQQTPDSYSASAAPTQGVHVAHGVSLAGRQAEIEPPRPKSRFATLHTRETPQVAPPAGVPEPVVEAPSEPVAEAKRSRFSTVITSPGGESAVRARPSSEDLARMSERGDPRQQRPGARIIGNVNPELLNIRLEADRKDFGPGPKVRPAAPAAPDAGDKKGGKRVVQSRDLYDKNKRNVRGKPGKGGKLSGPQPVAKPTTAAEHKRVVKMEEAVLVSELAHQMSVKAGEIAMKLMFELGVKGANINTSVDFDTAQLIADMYGFRVEQVGFDITKFLPKFAENEADFRPRPPVVTIMGHVDHGKTSLLDAIRKSRVAAGEAGGITQHIGAYMVEAEGGSVCFLDTPGHEAFSALRARGAQATDIVVLVVAADDGVMPQTVEAVNHARDASVPIIVAVNKIDKPGANPERIKQALTEYGLVAEEWGGTTMFCNVSALTRAGLDHLIAMIQLQAEVMQLTANPKRPAEGLIIESKLDVGRGPVATVLVQAGILRPGDIVVVGEFFGRVRTMIDERGHAKPMASPSTPVEITGLNGVPVSGDRFYVVTDADAAKSIAEHIGKQNRQADLALSVAATGGMDAVGQFMKSEEVKELKIVVKADVQGSVEAVAGALRNLSTDKVSVRVIHSAVGGITESDVNLAAAREEGVRVAVVGFNVRPEHRAHALAEQLGVRILTESIIYEIINKVKVLMTGLLEPVYVEEIQGKAEVRALFQVKSAGVVAGCMVLDGAIVRNGHMRVFRNNTEVFKGTVGSLRYFEKNVQEVKAGFECGISVNNFNDLKVGDVLECFTLKQGLATL